MKNVLVVLSFYLLTFGSTSAQASLNMKEMSVTSGMGTAYNDVWGYTHEFKEFAVIGSRTAINVLDVTDCNNPVLVHQWVDGSNMLWRDFKDYKDYIYSVCDNGNCNEGLQVINKNTFAQSQSTTEFTECHNIFIDKSAGKLYAVGTDTSPNGMFVYDIKTDPSNPILLKNILFGTYINDPGGDYYVHDVYVENDTAYCSHGEVGYMIWDLTDLENITLIGHEENQLNGYNHSSWRHTEEDYFYVAKESQGWPIEIFDVSNPAEPQGVTTFKDPLLPIQDTIIGLRPHNPYVYVDRLYISYYHDGVKVYDVNDAVNPELIGYYDTYPDNTNYSGWKGCWGIYPFLPSGCILASDQTYGLYTLKMTIVPSSSNRMELSNILIENQNKGIVFRTPDDEYKRLKIDINGDLELEDITTEPSEKLESINSNIKFSSPSNGIILTNGIKHFLVKLNSTTGFTISTYLGSLTDNVLNIEDQDLYFSQYRAGLIFTGNDGNCYHYTLGDSGTTEITQVDCD